VLERTIQVDGVPTRYLSAGSGPPLVLLHAPQVECPERFAKALNQFLRA
jgi:hypothetical protein